MPIGTLWTLCMLGPANGAGNRWRNGMEYRHSIKAIDYPMGTVAWLTEATTCSEWTNVREGVAANIAAWRLNSTTAIEAFEAEAYSEPANVEIMP